MNYFFQTIMHSVAFWLVFRIFLVNKPMHGFNRFYLLGSSVLPIVLPFIKGFSIIPIDFATAVSGLVLPEISISAADRSQFHSTGSQWFRLVYFSVSVSLFLVLMRRWWRLRKLAHASARIEKDGCEILLHTGYGPGSWWRYIFLPAGLPDERIIKHECTHIRLKHSIDTFVLSLLQCAFWYNPFIYLFRKELKMVHEYQADAAIAGDDLQYKELLLSNLFSTQNLHLANSFIHHPLKKRIMMFNSKISKSSRVMRSSASLVALTIFVTISVGFQSSRARVDESVSLISNSRPEETVGGDSVMVIVEKMPEFQGDLSQFLAENLVYPEYAKKKGIEGRVTLKFVIDKEGNLINKQVIRSAHDSLSRAALDVLDKMPKWIPGEQRGKKVAVSFTLPVSFKLK